MSAKSPQFNRTAGFHAHRYHINSSKFAQESPKNPFHELIKKFIDDQKIMP
ncbi:hypothetical protein ACU6VJ_21610 (plasmid) [Sphaerotilus sulfidivorans]